MPIGLSSPVAPMPFLGCSGRPSPRRKKNSTAQRQGGVIGNFGHLGNVVRKDLEFLKNGIGKAMEWANGAFRVPQLSKALDDVVWLRPLEDRRYSPPSPPLSWPSPSPYYPELSSVDLFLADVKALEAYASYFYHLSRSWSRPLSEVYDPEEVAGYFALRPHVLALRLLEVFFSFAAAAIRIRILGSGVRKVYRSNMENNIGGDVAQYNFGMVLKETMLNLGPTFIKVGQSLSTRPDIIGPEISKALSELHDQIPPFPRTTAMKIIEDELGSPVETYFSHISEEPVAAASFGQVYRGCTVDGLDVAVKVQRPNLQHVVVRDIYILRLGLGLLQKIAKRKSDPRLYADELGKGFVGELDYTLEATNALEFMEAHAPFSFIRVPKVFHHLSRKRVLTMEWMDGESPRDLIDMSTTESIDHGSSYSKWQQNDAKRRLLDLVNKGVEASLIQLLETGLLHADPHPGNIRFLDFGLLCQMQKKHQFAMLASIVHIVNGDWASLVHALTNMDVVRPGTNIWRVTKDLEDALGEVEFKDGIPDIKFSRVLGKIWSVAFKYHFRMPPYYTLVLRSLASLEGLAVAADPNFRTFEAAYPYVFRKLLTDNSVASRRILQSVVLNRQKEFQWRRLALFLRIGATRKGLHQLVASNGEISQDSANGAIGVFNVTNLVLRFLISKDGIVMRRLLMTADGAALIRTMVSKEAAFFRQQLCTVVADIIYLWMCEAFGQSTSITQYNSQVILASEPNKKELSSSSRLATSIRDYQYILGDRRLKLIMLKILDSARKNPVLMLRFLWSSFAILVTASALAFHRMLISLSEAYLSALPFPSKKVAVTC
ncbi:uncharacterized protein LOC127806070 isoform X2 [Diospyros lotus]|uniref:uncharacterized protein LOC127806070 isoform X2 n=1 Tax=Diospyros lotus TaxID=55363 RepID=UPI00225157AF|nr:uncharacterized protein LOC127806070 isoform X2 [Diospyros lotus]